MAADALATGLQEPVIIPTNQSSRFENTSAAGVNRIVPLDDYLVVNNIGRNWEVWQLSDSPDGPLVTAAALYDRTLFHGQDNPSIFDIDIHAALPSRDGRSLLIPNHYGRVRCFRLPLPLPGDLPEPFCQLQLLGDTERILLADDCLIASSTRGEQTTNPARPGIFISEPVTPYLDGGLPDGEPRRLTYRHELAGWGVVSALALDHHHTHLAVADEEHVGVFELATGTRGVRLGRCLWQVAVPYLSQWIEFESQDGRLLVAGYDRAGADPYGTSWDACRGGGVSAFSVTGDLLFAAALPPLTAWGYGSEAVTLSTDGMLYAIDRTAGLHRLDLATGQLAQLSAGLGASEGASLGIGHCAISHGHLYAGFSRGGYRLFRYKLI